MPWTRNQRIAAALVRWVLSLLISAAGVAHALHVGMVLGWDHGVTAGLVLVFTYGMGCVDATLWHRRRDDAMDRRLAEVERSTREVAQMTDTIVNLSAQQRLRQEMLRRRMPPLRPS